MAAQSQLIVEDGWLAVILFSLSLSHVIYQLVPKARTSPKREVYRDILGNIYFQYNIVGFGNSSRVTYVL